MSRKRKYFSVAARKAAERQQTIERRNTQDPDVRKGPEMQARVDLGLALLSMCAIYNRPLTNHDIACWAGCTDANIHRIVRRALVKLANVLSYGTRRRFGREFLGEKVT